MSHSRYRRHRSTYSITFSIPKYKLQEASVNNVLNITQSIPQYRWFSLSQDLILITSPVWIHFCGILPCTILQVCDSSSPTANTSPSSEQLGENIIMYHIWNVLFCIVDYRLQATAGLIGGWSYQYPIITLTLRGFIVEYMYYRQLERWKKEDFSQKQNLV